MKLRHITAGTLFAACLLLLASCANTNTPTGQAIAASLQQKAAMQAVGASRAPQRTGMQDFFARGGAQ